MTHYHPTFGTVRIEHLKREKGSRSWQVTLAPLRRLLSRLTLPNSAVQIAVVPVAFTALQMSNLSLRNRHLPSPMEDAADREWTDKRSKAAPQRRAAPRQEEQSRAAAPLEFVT